MLLIIILLLIIIINLMNVYFRKEKIIENNTGYDMSNTVKDCIVEWDNEWSQCSKQCGGGTQELGNKVLQEPEDGYWDGKIQKANQCPGTITRYCNEQPCSSACEGEWGPWSPCQKDDRTPAKCGGGNRSRIYNITKSPSHAIINGVLTPGTACPRKHGFKQNEVCNVKPCAVDCVGAWGDELSDCDKQTGTQFKTYKITTPAKDGYIYNTDGVEKPDPAVQCGAAHNEKQYTDCPVDCELTGWEWVRHNWELGSDVYERAIRIEPKNGGLKCDESLLKWEDKPVDCEGYWEDNGECEDYWKKQKYTIIGKGANGTGKACPHNAGDVRTLRPGIHTCSATHTTKCVWNTPFGCGLTNTTVTYAPNLSLIHI